MKLICLVLLLCVCSAVNRNVEAATMFRTVNNHLESDPSSRRLDQIKEKKDTNVPEWPEDDDDDGIDTNLNKVVQEQSVDHTETNDIAAAANTTSQLENDETQISATPPSLIDQENVKDDEEIITNEIITNEKVDNAENHEQNENNQAKDEKVDITNEVTGVDNDTLAMGEETPSMEYHRSQSTVQNEVPNDSTGDVRSFEQGENITMNNQENIINAENANNVGNDVTAFEGSEIANTNVPGNNVPPMAEVEQQQPPEIENTFVHYEDDEEESFFAMIQSTLQVLFLAAFFSLGLVFRRRVQDRMSGDSSLSASHAIQEEAVKVLTDLASWLSESQSNASNRNGGSGFALPTIAEGRASIGGDSGNGETVPLAIATDEEWGWDDEDVGGNVELPDVGASSANEDDDLAMAIAMSLSESNRGVSSESGRPTDVASSRSSSTPAPAIAVDKPSNLNEQQLAPPSDSIEDLLGQMSSSGGPVISSFGQKSKIEQKSKPKTTSNDDDIFASMGLSSFPVKTGPSQQQTSAPASTILKAESIDENDDGDEWGEDDDLDDLLLED